MKRKIRPSKPTISKRPNDQKLIEAFVLLNQAKTEIKKNNVNNKDNTKSPLDIDVKEEKK